MNVTKKIVQLAAPYPAVAFDVFDTLIKRDVGKPTDVFALQGEKFAEDRVRAEQKARSEATNEITLAQIYAQPGMEGYDPARECAWELVVSVANGPVLEAVRLLQAEGKRLYFISDMYLPPEQIHAMLRRCGYPAFDGGFVSSSYGVQKRSGALFHRFLRETGLSGKDVLFVGDSWRADVIGAALAGIRCWHLPTTAVKENSFQEGALRAFIANHGGLLADPGEKLGFTVLGALEVSFCQWIHARAAEKPESTIFFLSRDMFLTQRLYRELYPEEKTVYLEVSRRSLAPALLATREYALLLAALPRQLLTGEQIAAYCGGNCPVQYRGKTYNLKSEENQESVYQLLDTLQPAEEASLVLKYLQQSGLREGDFLVDIGSGGTTQMLLQHLMGVRLRGLQLSGDARLRKRLPSTQVEVFLSLEGKDATLYWAGQPILERMISQDIGATIGYSTKGDMILVQREVAATDERIDRLQRGVFRFLTEWQESALWNREIPAQLAIEPFLQMIGAPSGAQVDFLGPIQVEDGGRYSLAAPQKMRYYLLHPVQVKRDLSEARWKIGFLQKLLPGPIPYGWLYLQMKQHRER